LKYTPFIHAGSALAAKGSGNGKGKGKIEESRRN
jgi:hypothetical protein